MTDRARENIAMISAERLPGVIPACGERGSIRRKPDRFPMKKVGNDDKGSALYSGEPCLCNPLAVDAQVFTCHVVI
jgi:hypothetical protein